MGWAHHNRVWVEGQLRRAHLELPKDDARASLAILWTYCVEWYGSGQAPGYVVSWLDERWRWGTMENPDEKLALDPTVPVSAEEVAQGAGLLSLAGGPARMRGPLASGDG